MSATRALAIIPAVGTAAAGALLWRVYRSIAATHEEAALDLPGDDLLDHADVQGDRAVTIETGPEQVWPWIAQLGQDKAGFYSFETLENLAGYEIQNVDHIVAEWQHPQVGGPFPLAPNLELRLAVVEPGSALVATSEGGSTPAEVGFGYTWAFVLRPVDGGAATRLHVRERYRASSAGVRAMTHVLRLVSGFMSWKMLRTIKDLAERTTVRDVVA